MRNITQRLPGCKTLIEGFVSAFVICAAIFKLTSIANADIASNLQSTPDFRAQGASQGAASPTGSADNYLFTGSFLYNLPLEVPPGVSGVQPSLEVQYTSGQGNGWLGVGWDLSLGSIQRSLKTGIPTYTLNDTFTITFKGQTQELVYINNDASGNRIYQVKIEGTFLRIMHTNSSSQISQWYVWDKTGTKYCFGEATSSRVVAPSGVFLWSLNKVVDRNGNTIVYDYTHNSGYLYPQSILYTSNANPNSARTADRLISFELEDRPDQVESYRAKFSQVLRRRLQRIETFVLMNGSWTKAKTYTFAYSKPYLRVRSELISVTVSGANVEGTVTLPLTKIDYAQTGTGWVSPTTSIPPLPVPAVIIGDIGTEKQSADMGVRFADLNRDGKTDILVGRIDETPSAITVSNAYINTGQAWVDQSSTWKPPVAFTKVNRGSSAWAVIDMGARVADVNGDLLPDIIYANNYSGNVRKVWLNTGSGWQESTSWVLPAELNFSVSNSNEDQGFELVDVNADGLIDILQGKNQLSTLIKKCWINTGSGWALSETWTPPVAFVYSYSTPIGTRFVDLNNDGLVDILQSHSDISNIAPNISNKGIYLNTGAGWLKSTTWQPPFYLTYSGKHIGDVLDRAVQLVDVNGDGFADWVESTPYFSQGSPIGAQYVRSPDQRVLLNTGSAWATVSSSFTFPIVFNAYNIVGDRFNNYNKGIFFLDMNGDGQPDLVQSSQYNGNVTNSVWLSDAKPELIQTVRTAYGGQTDLQYTCSTLLPGNQQIAFPFEVLTRMEAKDGRGGSVPVTYTYENGFFDPVLKEFLGFEIVNTIDSEGNKTVTYHHQNKDSLGSPAPQNALKGNVYRVDTVDANGIVKGRREAKWRYSRLHSNKDVYFVYSEFNQNTILDGPAPVTSKIDFTYDSFGNITKMDNSGDLSVTGDERIENIEYAYNLTNYLVSFPKYTFVTAPGSAEVLTASLTLYDGNSTASLPFGSIERGNVTQVEKLIRWTSPTVGKWAKTKIEYNGFGQMTATLDALGNRTETTYDSFGFPIRVKNALNQITLNSYDPLTGNVLTTTDMNNQRVTSIYDGLGRKLRVIGPLDNTTYPSVVIDYHNELMGFPNQYFIESKTRLISGQSVAIWSKVFIDGMGRTYKTERQDVNGKSVSKETEFNNRGLISREATPHFSSEAPSQWMSTSYDSVGRIIRIQKPDNSVTTTRYEGRVTYVTDSNNNTQKSVSDAHDRIISREEPSIPNATTYLYDRVGNLIKLTDSQGKVTTFEYDALGRKTKLIDPNVGTWTYEFDDNGNLIKQTDARNYVISIQYDALSRLVSRTLEFDPNFPSNPPKNLATFTYDQITERLYSRGRVTSVKDASGFMEFFHDPIGRVYKQRKSIDSDVCTLGAANCFEFLTSYDALGSPTKKTYPNNFIVKYEYNPIGQLSRITNDDASIVYASYFSYDALGRATEVRQANEKAKTTLTYDQQKQLLSSIKTESFATGAAQTVRNWNYEYDAEGRLKKIDDLIQANRSQQYTYDSLDRLIEARGLYGTENYAYDSIGNFQMKAGVAYVYGDQAHPYAVTETRAAGAIATDNSTVLAWNLDPADPIYTLKGQITFQSSATANIPVMLTGPYEVSVKSNSSTNISSKGKFEFRGLAGSIYSVAVASTGFKSNPSGLAYNPLSQSQTDIQFGLIVETQTFSTTKLRIPRTAIASGVSSPNLSGGNYVGGGFNTSGYGGWESTGATRISISGYSPLPEGVDVGTHTANTTVPPPTALSTSAVGPTFTAGIHQKALSFNGTTDIFAVPNSFSFNPSALSVMIWAKPSAYPTTGYATLISKARSASIGQSTTGFRVLMNTSGKVVAEIGRPTGGAVNTVSTIALAKNEWTFVCATYDGATLRLYINGNLESSTPLTTAIESNTYPVTMGASLDTNNRLTTNSYFKGALDEPRIHNRLWTMDEVRRTRDQYLGFITYAYDPNGNMISKVTPITSWAYGYDSEGRIINIKKASANHSQFVYDANGMRVKKTSPEGTTKYVGKLLEVRPDGSYVNHVYAGDQLITDVVQTLSGGRQALHYHQDHLQSTALITDDTGNLVQTFAYKPFGEIFETVGTSIIRKKFTGQEDDSETGLFFYNARYYDPVLGRFLSADPLVQNMFDPQSLNRYVYVRNSPVNLIDPSGYFSLRKTFKKAKQWVNKHSVEVGIGLQIVVGQWAGVPFLAQTEKGRTILAGQLLVATGAGAIFVGGPVAIGAFSGELLGGYSAIKNGGSFFNGVVVGGAIGAASGYLGSQAGAGVKGALGEKTVGSVLSGAARGGIAGAGAGATTGYAGGAGNHNTILQGMLHGGALGAVAGGILGYVESNPSQSFTDKSPQQKLKELNESVNEVGKKAYESGEPIVGSEFVENVGKNYAGKQFIPLMNDLVKIPDIAFGLFSTTAGLDVTHNWIIKDEIIDEDFKAKTKYKVRF